MPARYLAALSLLTAFAVATIGCGSNSNASRALTSIAIMPATADAQSSPNGQVQFNATGTFSAPPSPAALSFQSPYTGAFSVDARMVNIVSTHEGSITVSCVAGASGSTQIMATACAGARGTAATCAIVKATAQLTCP